ncbi:hypothetical protein KM295_08420 [Natronomonas sp. F2-12]|jgi:uncharacterized UPF0146 family protein|uniref:UPF0146 protein KM295_08420 n=1 Tax=Natronomonas aquatica TaxID=2841590 RepID=A0A9R1D6S4_9EURY|nr:UPF0146 family protein [Natronomonas aquatica]MCQ4333502.1 hypothetical protein [Natronomonas aquatica]
MATLVDRLARYDELIEVGVGDCPDVAAALAERGCRVTATDLRERPVPATVRFVRDDVTDPDPSLYAGADAVYALNCPPELQGPLADAAETAGADCLFTTLGADPAVVEATPETLPAGTLFGVTT